MAKLKSGICYLVGAGPGDLGMVTLRAKECIEMADVIAYDYLVNPEVLAWARPQAEIIYVGKKAADHALPQDQINQLLIKKVQEGNIVTRLKGGDPLVFGRGGEEAEELVEAGCRFELVPGISSSIAGPAYAGIPVTHRKHNTQLTIFTGHEDPTKEVSSLDFKKIAQADGVKVMLMGVQRIGTLMDQLMSNGAAPETPVALVRWATTGRQQTVTGTMANIADVVAAANFSAPAVCIMGGTVTLRDKLRWFDNKPLFGKRIVVTRTRTQAGDLSRRLKALGADVFELPTIRIEPPMNMMQFGECVEDCHKYDWLLFTSPNGVSAFFELFFKVYRDVRSIGGCRIAAIGPGTQKKIREFHLEVDFVPEASVAESFVSEFVEQYGTVDNTNFLWVRGEDARPVISQELAKLGAIVDEAIAYRTLPETNDLTGAQKRFREEGADILTFASSSAVENFLKLNLPLPPNIQIASIGPITSKTIRENQLTVDIEAKKQFDIPHLVDAILAAAGTPEK
jgi:uroporphyrinogen III methyltransferase/synthase